MKKEYINPDMQVVVLQQQSALLAGSLQGSNTTGLDDDLNYDNTGGDQGNAW